MAILNNHLFFIDIFKLPFISFYLEFLFLKENMHLWLVNTKCFLN
ncbi:hypothetical protein EMIT0180MI3_12453 [Priestia megaterium]